jgi:hypothetical protein
MQFQARQGDIFVQQVPMRSRVGTAVSDLGRVVLSAGAESGQAYEVVAAANAPYDTAYDAICHAADEAAYDAAYDSAARPAAQLFEEPDGKRYLIVERNCMLVHADHAPVAVAPGCYRVTIQREYDPEGHGNVLD